MNIKRTLESILCDTPCREAVNHLVHTSFKMALAYLHHRLRRGSLVDHQFGISNEDLALDCIADLYQRDEAGRFTVITQYFGNTGWENQSEEELKVALRRLVFSKVNEGLFRSYREEDPNLAKIIRNVKEAAKQDKRISLVRHKEASWLVVGSSEEDIDHLPLAPAEVLEAFILPIVCDTSNTYKTVSSFADFNTLHPHYCNAYPLTAFAQVLRSSFINRVVPEEEAIDQTFAPLEVETAIQRAVSFIQSTLHDTYVKGGKLSLALFDTYVMAVRKVLSSSFTLSADPIDSQYEALQSLMPNLSKDAYMTDHRNILQYLFKLSRTRMIAYLKEEG